MLLKNIYYLDLPHHSPRASVIKLKFYILVVVLWCVFYYFDVCCLVVVDVIKYDVKERSRP